MSKYAELPSGELLEFPDETPDKVIQRTVRKELGVTDVDIIADKLDGLAKQTKEHKIKLADDSFDPLAQATRTLGRQVKEATNALILQSAQMGTSMEQAAKALAKSNARAEESMSALVLSLAKVIDSLNNSVKALGGVIEKSAKTSSAIVESHNKMAAAIGDGLEQSLRDFAQATMQVVGALTQAQRTARLSRRAYRNSDGSWTLETGTANRTH